MNPKRWAQLSTQGMRPARKRKNTTRSNHPMAFHGSAINDLERRFDFFQLTKFNGKVIESYFELNRRKLGDRERNEFW